MSLALFLTFRHPDAQALPQELMQAERKLAALSGLTEALVMTPAATHDPYLDDGRPPPLMLQLAFAGIEDLEAALAGPLQAVVAEVPSLAGATIGEQAMLARGFPVPEPSDTTERCSYMVAYDGHAADANVWLSYYIAHHPAIMARFPAIRAIEICTRIDWCSASGFDREDYLQRNKVVFDDAAALTAALNSPTRHEMRADFKKFPPFEGSNTHFPMHTAFIPPGR